MYLRRLATVSFIALGLITACSPADGPTTASPSGISPSALDGTYRVEIDGLRTLRDGAPSPETSTTLRWAFRSSCGATCIAVAVPVSEEDPPKVGESAVWDYVNGAWVKTVTGRLTCGGSLSSTLETWSLRPVGSDTLTGTRHLAFFGPDCGSVLEQFVTVSRIGSVHTGLHIPDPATQAALKPSAGAALRGRYNKVQTPVGQPAMPVIMLTIATNCIRNTEHCLTYTVYEPPDRPRRVSGYQLLDGRWFSSVPYDVTCPDGRAVHIVVETQWRLPQRPADPIPRLVGTQRDHYAEPCARTVESQLVLERVGD